MRTWVAILSIAAIVSLAGACIFGGSATNNGNNQNNSNNEPNPELCGNGRLDPGETCDPCESFSCPSGGCGIWAQTGSAQTCDLECVKNGEQTACGNGDGCCPDGCMPDNDDDCSENCGDGVLDADELCDPCPDDCPASPCERFEQTGDASTCDLFCDPLPPVIGCCGGGICPDGMSCNDGTCVEPRCETDTDCDENEICDDGVCAQLRGCVSQNDCLPWQNCSDDGVCVTPPICKDAQNPQQWCAFHHLVPDASTQECYEEAGTADSCVEYMPSFCMSDDECTPWEYCGGTDGDCTNQPCDCRIAASCDNANDPNVYCLYMTGDPASICDVGRQECR